MYVSGMTRHLLHAWFLLLVGGCAAVNLVALDGTGKQRVIGGLWDGDVGNDGAYHIPYFIDAPNPQIRSRMAEEMANGAEYYKNRTCMVFEEISSTVGVRRFVTVTINTDPTSKKCSANGWFIYFPQSDPCPVVHELLHVLGFLHEHQRKDRDAYVQIDSSMATNDQYAVKEYGHPTGPFDMDTTMFYKNSFITAPLVIPFQTEPLTALDLDVLGTVYHVRKTSQCVADERLRCFLNFYTNRPNAVKVGQPVPVYLTASGPHRLHDPNTTLVVTIETRQNQVLKSQTEERFESDLGLLSYEFTPNETGSYTVKASLRYDPPLSASDAEMAGRATECIANFDVVNENICWGKYGSQACGGIGACGDDGSCTCPEHDTGLTCDGQFGCHAHNLGLLDLDSATAEEVSQRVPSATKDRITGAAVLEKDRQWVVRPPYQYRIPKSIVIVVTASVAGSMKLAFQPGAEWQRTWVLEADIPLKPGHNELGVIIDIERVSPAMHVSLSGGADFFLAREVAAFIDVLETNTLFLILIPNLDVFLHRVTFACSALACPFGSNGPNCACTDSGTCNDRGVCEVDGICSCFPGSIPTVTGGCGSPLGIHGDPHFVSFHGDWFDWHGVPGVAYDAYYDVLTLGISVSFWDCADGMTCIQSVTVWRRDGGTVEFTGDGTAGVTVNCSDVTVLVAEGYEPVPGMRFLAPWVGAEYRLEVEVDGVVLFLLELNEVRKGGYSTARFLYQGTAAALDGKTGFLADKNFDPSNPGTWPETYEYCKSKVPDNECGLCLSLTRGTLPSQLPSVNPTEAEALLMCPNDVMRESARACCSTAQALSEKSLYISCLVDECTLGVAASCLVHMQHTLAYYDQLFPDSFYCSLKTKAVDPATLECTKCRRNWYPDGDCTTYCHPRVSCNEQGLCNARGQCECSDGWTGERCALMRTTDLPPSILAGNLQQSPVLLSASSGVTVQSASTGTVWGPLPNEVALASGAPLWWFDVEAFAKSVPHDFVCPVGGRACEFVLLAYHCAGCETVVELTEALLGSGWSVAPGCSVPLATTGGSSGAAHRTRMFVVTLPPGSSALLPELASDSVPVTVFVAHPPACATHPADVCVQTPGCAVGLAGQCSRSLCRQWQGPSQGGSGPRPNCSCTL